MFSISNELPHIEHDGFLFKIEVGEPSEQVKQIAQDELRESPENIENGLKELRRLLKDEVDLFCPIDNDLWLMSFLRPAHFYPEKARDMIRGFYNFRRKYPELHEGLNFEMVKDVVNAYNGSTLPQRDQYGRRMYVILSGKYWDPKKFDTFKYLQVFIVQLEFLRSEPETQICGIVVLLDMLDLTMRQAFLIKPKFLKRLIDLIQDGLGLRFKGFHILNQPKIFDIVFGLAKPFIRESYFKEIYFHGKDMSSLHQHISPECLPECYGGTLKALASYGPQYYRLYKPYEEEFFKYLQYGYKS